MNEHKFPATRQRNETMWELQYPYCQPTQHNYIPVNVKSFLFTYTITCICSKCGHRWGDRFPVNIEDEWCPK